MKPPRIKTLGESKFIQHQMLQGVGFRHSYEFMGGDLITRSWFIQEAKRLGMHTVEVEREISDPEVQAFLQGFIDDGYLRETWTFLFFLRGWPNRSFIMFAFTDERDAILARLRLSD